MKQQGKERLGQPKLYICCSLDKQSGRGFQTYSVGAVKIKEFMTVNIHKQKYNTNFILDQSATLKVVANNKTNT